MIRQLDVQTGKETTRQPTSSEQAFWDAGKAQALADAPKREIARLEATITPRRIRDALANDAGKKWVADVEALIATERGKL
tara:strand:+ start:233 stop:475 length:243 start_codon:yes stop_codon:yes gene_type:complete